MLIPPYLNIFGYPLATIFVVLVLSSLVSLFVYWHETRRDGFDEEHALDLFIACLFSAIVLSRFMYGATNDYVFKDILLHTLKFWEYGFDPVGLAIGLLFPVVLFTNSWKWSVYRITDIMTVSLACGSVVLLSGIYLLSGTYLYLYIALLYLIFGSFLIKIRLRVRSGLAFSAFMFLNALIGFMLDRSFLYLLFYVTLITISILNLYLREKRNPMNQKLSANFIKKIQNVLTTREKKLTVEQSLLIEEDPYLEDGRDSDNSDPLDDAFEDTQKEVNDMRKAGVDSMLQKVRKALARIKTGEYGTCSVCGKEISKGRLEAFPEVTTCKDCATKENPTN